MFLDYGGGIGTATLAATEAGYDAYLYDIDQESRRYAVEKLGLPPGKVLSDIGDMRFDFIYSDNVIEHLVDPYEHIQYLYSRLAKHGYLGIRTPRLGSLEEIFFPNTLIYIGIGFKYNSILRTLQHIALNPWWCCAPPRHLYGLNDQSMAAICRRLDVSEHKIINHSKAWTLVGVVQCIHMLKRKPLKISHLLYNMVGLIGIVPYAAMDLFRPCIVGMFPWISHQFSVLVERD